MKIGIIPSDNGLGHIRRMTLLSNFLSHKFDVTILVNKKKNLFKQSKKVKTINIKKILNLKSNNYRLSDKIKIKKLCINFDLIIIDNFPDLLKLSKKIIIFSNFFWHKELNLKNKKFKKIEYELRQKKIQIFGNYLFQKNYFKRFDNLNIPFFGSYKKRSKKDSILISIGTAKYGETDKIKKTLLFHINKGDFKDLKIYLDPIFYDENFKKTNIIKADFTSTMYDKIKFALIKPGLGTVEECLMRGIPIVAYTKNTFSEFKYNSKIIKRYKLGYSFNTINESINFIIKNFYNKILLSKHDEKCKKLKWNGEKKIKDYLRINKYI